MNPTTIVVPIDFSDCSMELVEKACEIAGRRDARLLLLHVIERPSGLSLSDRIHPGNDNDGQTTGELLERAAQARLAHYVSIAERARTPVCTAIRTGDAATAILETAAKYDADMIIMGTHGRTGLSRALLGSVASDVQRRATCPVTTVRTQHKPICEASGCAWCASHVTPEQRRLAAEVDG